MGDFFCKPSFKSDRETPHTSPCVASPLACTSFKSDRETCVASFKFAACHAGVCDMTAYWHAGVCDMTAYCV